jgi:hypothetical protein
VREPSGYWVGRAGLDALWLVVPALLGVLLLLGWREALGLSLGWGVAAGSLLLSASLLPRWIRTDSRLVDGHARLLGLGAVKFPVFGLAAFGAASLGLVPAACFVLGAVSVYLAMAAGALRSLRSRE